MEIKENYHESHENYLQSTQDEFQQFEGKQLASCMFVVSKFNNTFTFIRSHVDQLNISHKSHYN